MRIAALLLLLVNGLGALYGGWVLMADPSGEGMHMPLIWLKYSPFKNYFIPGLVLFCANGLLSIIISVLVIVSAVKYVPAIIAQGLILGGWIGVQIIMLRTLNMLQLVFLTIAICLIMVGVLLQKTKKLVH